MYKTKNGSEVKAYENVINDLTLVLSFLSIVMVFIVLISCYFIFNKDPNNIYIQILIGLLTSTIVIFAGLLSDRYMTFKLGQQRQKFLEDVLGQKISESLSHSMDEQVIPKLMPYMKLGNLKPEDGLEGLEDRLILGKLKSEIENSFDIKFLNTWIPNMAQLSGSILKAIEKGACIEILIAHPRSELVQLRDVALQSEGRVGTGVRDNLRILKDIYNKMNADTTKYPGQLSVYLYQTLPSFSLFMIDQKIYTGFFWHSGLAIEKLQVISLKHSRFGDALVEEFETIKNERARKIDISNYDKQVKF